MRLEEIKLCLKTGAAPIFRNIHVYIYAKKRIIRSLNYDLPYFQTNENVTDMEPKKIHHQASAKTTGMLVDLDHCLISVE
jgi:hypothetical protein